MNQPANWNVTVFFQRDLSQSGNQKAYMYSRGRFASQDSRPELTESYPTKLEKKGANQTSWLPDGTLDEAAGLETRSFLGSYLTWGRV